MIALLNFAAFQVGWFAAVLGAANGLPWAGPLVIALAIGLHLKIVRRPRTELTLILICGLIGAAMDSVLVALGWVAYPGGSIVDNAAPYWIVAMWMLFATTLNISLGWLKPRKFVGAIFGLVGGPLAYYTGFKLGGIEFVNFDAAIVSLGIGWAVVVPLLLVLAERFNGVDERAPRASTALAGEG
ncbi:MAG: DUF2878 domain-containing protein [Woeseiaceae bacterium]|nr:DUF2878 domain-containing protein [Woeseiaceae bacterium]